MFQSAVMSGITTAALTDAETQRLRTLYSSHRDFGQSYVRVSPSNCLVGGSYEKHKDRIYNFKLRPEDVFILAWAKNGTTFTQEIVWCIQNNLDFETAKSIYPLLRVPFLEFITITEFLTGKEGNFVPFDSIAPINEMPSPRVVKSHLPYCLLPPSILDECKVVTCLRNPKDTLVSFYHHEKLIIFHGFLGDFAEFFEMFMDDMIIYSSYWTYVLDAWRRREHPNLCLLFFEDMKADLEGSVRKVANFLQKDFSEDQLKQLAEYVSFKKIKETSGRVEEAFRQTSYLDPNDKQKSFFRKGEVGDWKNYFTADMNRRMDERIEKEFAGSGLQFRYE